MPSEAEIVNLPAILMEKWDVMLLCIVVATASSLMISSRFANRANNRTVGLATGVVLTILGGAMLVLTKKSSPAKAQPPAGDA